MRLIAVANISDGQSTIGLRLLDVDKQEIKDVPINNIKQALSKQMVSIENVELSDGKVVGSNGSIDRLTKIIEGMPIGKRPLLIIDKLDNGNYRVADYNGCITTFDNEYMLKYCSLHGVANGKVVKKDGQEFISAISGSHKTNSTGVRSSKGKLYTGELVDNLPKLKPILISNRVIDYVDGKVEVSKIASTITDIGSIKRGIVYETDKYTLNGDVSCNLDLNKNIKELDKLIRLKQNRGSIQGALFGLKDNKGLTNDCYLYADMEFMEGNRIPSYSETGNLSDVDVNNYIRIIGNKLNIHLSLEVKNKTLLLGRRCTSKGIEYKAKSLTRFYTEDGNITVTLEDVHANADAYQNVVVKDNYMTIVGLDGVYKYDMDKIYDTYNRKIIKTNRSIKALMVDPSYKEVINSIGELKFIGSDRNTIIIPKEIKYIKDSAISLTDNNKTIMFGNSIEECSKKCIVVSPKYNNAYNGHTLQKVVIDNKYRKVRDNILASLKNIDYLVERGIIIEYTGDIEVEEYADMLYSDICTRFLSRITANNISDQKFIEDTIDLFISKHLNGFDILTREVKFNTKSSKKTGDVIDIIVDKEYIRIKESFKLLKKLWRGTLSCMVTYNFYKLVSKEFYSKMEKIIKQAHEFIKYRDKELEKSIRKYKLFGEVL